GPTTARAQEAARTFALEDDGGGEAGSLPAPGPHVPWLDLPAHRTWLEGEGDELLVFGSESVRDDGGFAWLDEDGAPDLERPSELWITCRMTHSFALGHLLGRPDFGRFADHGIASLRGVFHDPEHGG